jgi:hypothetical protein
MVAKKKIRSADQSFVNLRSDAKQNAQSFNNLWRVADKSMGFLRKPKMNGKKRATQKNVKGVEVVVPQRANKTIRKFPLRVMLSGAASQAGAVLASETKSLRVDAAGEVNVSGALPSISKGAELLIEKFLITYAKTATANAVAIRDSLKVHKKTTEGCMAAACEILNGELRNTGGIAPGTLLLGKKSIKRRKAKESTVEPETADV